MVAAFLLNKWIWLYDVRLSLVLRGWGSFLTQMFYTPRDGSSEGASLAIERSPAELSQAPCYPLCRQMAHMCTPKTLAN